MSEQPEALRLADQLEALAKAWKVGSEPSLFRLDIAALLRCQHSRIEADEALMRTAVEALESMADHIGMTMNQASAITALRARLEMK